MGMFSKMIFQGLKRRKKEIRYVSVVTFIAVFFMTAITLFQEIMDNYLMETNYQNYGDWVLSAVEDRQANDAAFQEITHPYLAETGVCRTGEKLLDQKNNPSNVYVGTVDAKLRVFGNLALYEGSFPNGPDEIAMDLVSLAALGYSYELGQTIRVAVRVEDQIIEGQYRLTGTLKSFAGNWKYMSNYYLPNCLVTEEGLKKLHGPCYTTHFYQLDRRYADLDMEEFVSAFSSSNPMITYNSYVYENRIWGSREMFGAVKLILAGIGALAIGYLMMSYVSQRRQWYYRLRCMGFSKMQIRKIVFLEAVYGALPYAIVAIFLSYLAGAAICYGVSIQLSLPYFFKFRPQDLGIQLLASVGILFFAVFCAWFASRDKRLGQNRNAVTVGQIRRIRKDARKERNTGSVFLRRQRKLHPFQHMASVLFTVGVSCLLVFCVNKIYQASEEYRMVKEYNNDFTAGKTNQVTIRGELKDNTPWEGARDAYDMYHVLDQSVEEEILSLIGIQKIDWMLKDELHILQWEKQKDSPLEKVKQDYYENNMVDSNPQTQFIYYEDCDGILAELEKEQSLDTLHTEAFRNGEEIILMLFDYENWQTGEKIRENTISPGDTVEIVSIASSVTPEIELDNYHLPGRVPVKVGAVLTDLSMHWQIELQGPVYGILASQALAERVALADKKQIGHNFYKIDFNNNQSFESTQKCLASIAEKNGIFYQSESEMLSQSRDVFIREFCIYGVVFCTILFVFLLLQIHFHQMQNQYRKGEYRLLKQLGMEHSFFCRITLKESVGQVCFLLLSIPCSYAILFSIFYWDFRKQLLESPDITVWSDFLGEYTQNLFWISWDQLNKYTHIGFSVVLVALLMAGLIFISYQQASKYEKGEEWI